MPTKIEGGILVYRIKPYRRNDVFDLFDNFFNDTTINYRGNLKIDVRDLAKEYIVDVDVPGLVKDDIQIHFENERLIISVSKEERYTSSVKRSIYLKDVDPTKFKAKLENGVLTITAQKQEEKINKYMIDIE